MARDRDRHADAGCADRVRRHPRGGSAAGHVDRRPRLLDVPDRTTGPERGRVHPDRPQIERAVPRKPSVAGRIFRRNRGRNAGRLSAAELGRPRHLGTHSPARPRGGPHARGVPSRRVGGLVHDRLRRLDPVQGHEADLALLGLALPRHLGPLPPPGLVAGLPVGVLLSGVWAGPFQVGFRRLAPVKGIETIWPYSALLTNLFGILPPVFYPLSKVPIEWRSLVL